MFPPMSPLGERVRVANEQRELEWKAAAGARAGQRGLLRRLSARLQGWAASMKRQEAQPANPQSEPRLTKNVSA